MARIDLTGRRFGKWAVLGEAEKSRPGRVYCKCRCDCGTVAEVRDDGLKRGASTGCRRCGHDSKVIRLAPGARVESWTVLEDRQLGVPAARKILCRCDCGRERSIAAYKLTGGRAKMCSHCSRHRLMHDLAGQRVGRWLVIERRPPRSYLCRCDCGVEKEVGAQALYEGKTSQCIACSGAARRGLECRKRPAVGYEQHGKSHSITYSSWSALITRCTNPNTAAWKRYGGRGITVCERWRCSFASFLADMGERPSRKHSIDRYPNPDGNYEPGNCRWATAKEQCRNTSRNRLVMVYGESMTATDAAERFGVVSGVIVAERLRHGWGDESAVLTPLHSDRRE